MPQTRQSLGTDAVEFLRAILSLRLFYLAVLLKIPKARTGVLKSGHSFACPFPQNNTQFPKGFNEGLYQPSLAYSKGFGH